MRNNIDINNTKTSCIKNITSIPNKKKVTKETAITFRCTAKQKEIIRNQSKEAGISESKFIIDKCFPDINKKQRNITALRKRQEFVNQINSKLSKCNSFTYVEFIKQLSDMVKEEEDDIHADVEKFRA